MSDDQPPSGTNSPGEEGDASPPRPADPWAGLPPPRQFSDPWSGQPPGYGTPPPPSDPWSAPPLGYGGSPPPPATGYGQPGYGQGGYAPGGYAPGGYQPPWPPAYQPVPVTNGMAIASMVLGILWLYWIGSVLALVFGYMARRQIDESQGLQTGRGMATAGIVLGWIGIGFIAIFLFFGLIFAAGVGFP